MTGAETGSQRAGRLIRRWSLREIAAGAAFLLPVLVLLVRAADFPFVVGSEYSDLTISHYPNMLFLKRSLAAGEFPLWSPGILSGAPFAANPLSGLWYLPGWMALLFPLPLGINLALALHILWGGAGMFKMIRAEGARAEAALLGALAFTALPKIFSHLGAGHVTLLFAVSWTPWVLFAERRWGGELRAKRLLPGAALAMTALADPRWAAYAGLLWLAYALRVRIAARSPKDHPASQPDRSQEPLKRTGGDHQGKLFGSVPWIVGTAAAGIFALLGAAPLLIPLAEYTRISSRAALSGAENLILSLPPGNLLGLFYPTIAGPAEWMLYPGAVIMALSILSLFPPSSCRASRLWLGLALASILLALGENFPLLPFIWSAPGLNLLRVPARALFLAGLALAAAAAWALHALLARVDGEEKARRDPSAPALFAVTVFVVLFGAAGAMLVEDAGARLRFSWGAAAFLLAAGLALALKSGRLPARAAVTALSALLLADLCGVTALSLEFRSPAVVMGEQAQVVEYLRSQGGEGPFRIYSPSYSLPQHIAAWNGIELADGVDPLRLAAYDAYMVSAAGVPFDGYSVTLPAFASGNPAGDNRDFLPNARMLGKLNVRFVAAEFPLDVDGLDEVLRAGETRVYRNRYEQPRARVGDLPAMLIERGANRITARAEGPGRLVLAEIAAPGWQVTVDGKPVTMETEEGLFRAVTLEAGAHTVRFEYRPPSVLIGAVTGGLVWVSLAAALAWERWRKKSGGSA